MACPLLLPNTQLCEASRTGVIDPIFQMRKTEIWRNNQKSYSSLGLLLLEALSTSWVQVKGFLGPPTDPALRLIKALVVQWDAL